MQSFPIAAGGYGGPRWVGITWSLAIEEQFYFLFPLAVYFLSRRSLLLAALAGIAVSPILRDLFERLYGQWYAPYVLLPSRVDALMFGVLLAILVRNGRALLVAVRLRYFLDLIALGCAYLVATTHPWLSIWPSSIDSPFPPLKQTALAIVCAVIILRVFLFERSAFNAIWKSKILSFFGLISYALYMYHQSVNGLVHAYLFGNEPVVNSWVQFWASLIVMTIAVGLATLSYFWMERPVRRFGHRLSDRLAAKVAPSAFTGRALERANG
jgi:peptidoglycan/LPS O-acetylase OafA/YrhL